MNRARRAQLVKRRLFPYITNSKKKTSFFTGFFFPQIFRRKRDWLLRSTKPAPHPLERCKQCLVTRGELSWACNIFHRKYVYFPCKFPISKVCKVQMKRKETDKPTEVCSSGSTGWLEYRMYKPIGPSLFLFI